MALLPLFNTLFFQLSKINVFSSQPTSQFPPMFLFKRTYYLCTIKSTLSEVYNSVAFTIFTKQCKHPNFRKFLSFQKKKKLSPLVVTLYSPIHSPAPGNHGSNLYLDLPTVDIACNEIMQYVVFFV